MGLLGLGKIIRMLAFSEYILMLRRKRKINQRCAYRIPILCCDGLCHLRLCHLLWLEGHHQVHPFEAPELSETIPLPYQTAVNVGTFLEAQRC